MRQESQIDMVLPPSYKFAYFLPKVVPISS